MSSVSFTMVGVVVYYYDSKTLAWPGLVVDGVRLTMTLHSPLQSPPTLNWVQQQEQQQLALSGIMGKEQFRNHHVSLSLSLSDIITSPHHGTGRNNSN